jgi:hypothetical protein
MNVNVWLVYKDGEDRTYTWTTKPHEDNLARWRQQGYQVFRAEIKLPLDEDTRRLESVASLVPPVSVVANQTSGSAIAAVKK